MFAETSISAAPPTPAVGSLRLRSLASFPEDDISASDPSARVAHWVRVFLMRPHPDLGRSGAVCPYTPIAAKTGLARIGVSVARDVDTIFAAMREAVIAFETMECPRAHRVFRTVLVAFPNCEGEEGRARLKQVQNRLRSESTRKGKMIGLFEPHSEDKGLINPDFRPLRSPVPLLAIRSLVENDAPFVLRNPRLAPIYLLKHPISGPRKLLGLLWR